jgi:uncharacterized protein (DUF3084 family)
MTGGILFILAVLIIGGVIAPIGDRLGSRIGRARLSLFGMRPRDTATWVTIFTGMLISGLSLGFILLVSDQYRDGLFRIKQVRSDLSQAQQQEQLVQAELKTAKEERTQAQAKLQETLRAAEASNRQRQEAQEKQQLAQKNLQASEVKLKAADTQLQKAKQSYAQVQQQLVALKDQEKTLQGRLDGSQKQLAQLENQRTKLQKDIKTLGGQLASLQTKNKRLAQNNVVLNTALRRGEVILQSGELMYAVRIQGGLGSNRLREALDSVLSQTEQEVRRRGAQPYYQFGQRAVLIKNAEVDRLVTELQKPGEYALQIFVAQNVLLGEPVPVVGRVLPNLHLFDKGIMMATRIVNPKDNDEQLIAQLKKLFQDASVKARKAGILANSQGEVGTAAVPVDQMIGQIHQLQGTVVVQALTANDVYTAGPLQLLLNVMQDGKVVGQFNSSG